MTLNPGINITRVPSFTLPAAPQRIKAKLSDRRVVAEGNSNTALKIYLPPNIHRAAAVIRMKRSTSPFQDKHNDRLLQVSLITDLY